MLEIKDDIVIGGIIINLPYPPSVNRIWRSTAAKEERKVYLSPSYKLWRDEANAVLMTQRGWMANRITGLFIADIALCPPKGHQRGDLDNRIKAVLDFLQRATVIANDKHCQRVTAYWCEPAEAPEGCRVRVAACSPQTMRDVLRNLEAITA